LTDLGYSKILISGKHVGDAKHSMFKSPHFGFSDPRLRQSCKAPITGRFFNICKKCHKIHSRMGKWNHRRMAKRKRIRMKKMVRGAKSITISLKTSQRSLSDLAFALGVSGEIRSRLKKASIEGAKAGEKLKESLHETTKNQD